MSKLIIDMAADASVLRAGRNMLNELLGDTAYVVTEGISAGVEVVAKDDPESLDEGSSGTTGMSRGKATVAGGAAVNSRVDPQGVNFDPEFCGEAAEPFYASGKRAGQWKKKRGGVTEEAYDAWYAEQVAALATPGGDTPEDEQVDTAGAFAGATEPVGDPAPEDCGAFMGWVSAKQAAGLLTQEDIGNAYAQAGVQVTDLFPPNDESTVASNVAALYQILVVKAGA